jgi:hypothetical protein
MASSPSVDADHCFGARTELSLEKMSNLGHAEGASMAVTSIQMSCRMQASKLPRFVGVCLDDIECGGERREEHMLVES